MWKVKQDCDLHYESHRPALPDKCCEHAVPQCGKSEAFAEIKQMTFAPLQYKRRAKGYFVMKLFKEKFRIFGRPLQIPRQQSTYIQGCKVDVVGIEMQSRVLQVFHFPLGNTTQGTSFFFPRRASGRAPAFGQVKDFRPVHLITWVVELLNSIDKGLDFLARRSFIKILQRLKIQ